MAPRSGRLDSSMQSIVVTFCTPLGWVALLGDGEVLRGLSFGHPDGEAALRSLQSPRLHNVVRGKWKGDLVQRLKAYAAGIPVDFTDVPIDPGPLPVFWRQVVAQCRQVPYGQTLTYGQLAARAGSSRAARAVGNCMAANRIPLIVPCHRVVPACGGVGDFSAPGARTMKSRLLRMEREHSP